LDFHSELANNLTINHGLRGDTWNSRGEQITEGKIAVADKLCAVASNICLSSEFKLIHGQIQVLRISSLLLDFWKICALLP